MHLGCCPPRAHLQNLIMATNARRIGLVAAILTPLFSQQLIGQAAPTVSSTVPVVTSTALTADMTASVTTVAAQANVMLVGFLSVSDDDLSQRFYGASLPVIQSAMASQEQILAALTPHASGPPVVSPGPFRMPAALTTRTVSRFTNACLPPGPGFSAAATAMTQRATNHQLAWQAISSSGPLTSLIPWGQTWPGEFAPRTVMNQESLARQLVVNQYALSGEPVAGPYAKEVDFIIFLSSRIQLRLHLLPIEVAAGPTGGSRPLLKVGRSFSIPFTPSTQPEGWYFRFVDPSGEFYLYPATPTVDLEIQLAAPIHSQTVLANLQVQFAGGGHATNIIGSVGSDSLICTIPNSAGSCFFFVTDMSSNNILEMAGPLGPRLAARLHRVYLD